MKSIPGTAEIRYPNGSIDYEPVEILKQDSPPMIGIRLVRGPLEGYIVLVDPSWFDPRRFGAEQGR